MEIAKKYLKENLPLKALERLKELLDNGVNPEDEWKVHELFSAAFADLGAAEMVVKANFNAMRTDKILRAQRRHFSNYLFTLHYLENFDEDHYLQSAQMYNMLYQDVDISFQNTAPRTQDKIHVAFMAPNFYDSSAARFYESLLTCYDKEKFYVSLWSLADDKKYYRETYDSFTGNILYKVNEYHNVSEVSFEEIAQEISDADADVFFDLGGHTEGGATLQIASYKPARVRMTGFGYFDTTGLDAIDFYVTDEFLARGNQEYFTEKMLVLDNGLVFTPSRNMRFRKWHLRREPKPNFIFACYNNFLKITDRYLYCVKEILNAVPEAKMIFRDTTPLKSRQDALTERLKEYDFPMDRVEVLCSDPESYLHDYEQISLVLDTFPYTGGMMTALAIYFEVPVLNLCGMSHSQRLGADMLRLAGLKNFIVTNTDDYINFAVNFAKNPTPIEPNKRLFRVMPFVKSFYRMIERVMKCVE